MSSLAINLIVLIVPSVRTPIIIVDELYVGPVAVITTPSVSSFDFTKYALLNLTTLLSDLTSAAMSSLVFASGKISAKALVILSFVRASIIGSANEFTSANAQHAITDQTVNVNASFKVLFIICLLLRSHIFWVKVYLSKAPVRS